MIVRTIFTTPHSVGSRFIEHFQTLSVPTLALACCAVSIVILVTLTCLTTLQLCCALEEWETGVWVNKTFDVANYRTLYNGISGPNTGRILSAPACVTSSTHCGHVSTVMGCKYQLLFIVIRH